MIGIQALTLAIMLEAGDDIQLDLIGGKQLKGVFIGGGQSCVLINGPHGKKSIPLKVIANAEVQSNSYNGDELGVQVQNWLNSEYDAIEKRIPKTPIWVLISVPMLHPSIPYIATRQPKDALIATAFDTVLIGGMVYGGIVEKSWGLLLPFALSTVLFRYWIAKDVYSHLKSLRTDQNRLKQPNIAFCMD